MTTAIWSSLRREPASLTNSVSPRRVPRPTSETNDLMGAQSHRQVSLRWCLRDDGLLDACIADRHVNPGPGDDDPILDDVALDDMLAFEI